MTEQPVLQPDRGPGLGNGRREPIFNLPGILTAALGLLVAIYVIQEYLLSADMRDYLVFMLGFIPARYVYPLSEQGFEWLWSPISYSLLHGGIEHLVFNCLWLAAFGAPVTRRIGTVRFLIFWVTSAAASAFLYLGLHWGEAALLIGASGVISAFMGAACRFAFPAEGRRSYPGRAHLNPRLSLVEALTSRMVVMFVLFWFAGNLLIAFGIPLVGGDMGQVAWEAHIGGFLFGFLLFGLFDPQPADVRA